MLTLFGVPQSTFSIVSLFAFLPRDTPSIKELNSLSPLHLISVESSQGLCTKLCVLGGAKVSGGGS